MGIPLRYRKSGESTITYDFTDIASGSGYEEFYLAVNSNHEAVSYDLLTNRTHSCSGQIITSSDRTYEFYTNTFNLPRSVKGIAVLSLGFHINGGTGSLKAQLKISGANSVNISSEISGAGLRGDLYGMELFRLPLTETIVKKGDQLRLTLKLHVVDGGNMEVGTDPMGKDGSFASTQTTAVTDSTLFVPFKIDL